MFENYPDIMSVEQLCSALNIGKNTAYKLLNTKELKSVRVGRSHKIPKIWLIEFLTKTA